jgi:DedD protein
MSLFSFLRKAKQEPASDEGAYYSRAEEESQNSSRAKQKQTSVKRRDDPLDPVLPEKKRARRRLVGAVALVLAVVIGLPMILDSEPKPLNQELAIHIPSKDKAPPMERAAAPDSPAAPVEAPEPARAEPAVQAEAPAAKTKPASVPSAPVPAPVAGNTGFPVPVPAAAPGGVGKVDDGARALALLEGRADPRAADQQVEKFAVQIAALASREKVNELQAKLTDAGIKSYTQTVATAGGERTRVRVGPFTSRDEAELMRMRIVKLGLNGTLVPA